MQDVFRSFREILPDLIARSQQGQKVAFCFSGGGARGAYFGGVMEAIQQEINRAQPLLAVGQQRWMPDIICGTSAGSIAGFCYWVECLLPGGSPPFACRQTNVWRDAADGNAGARKLFGNSAVVEYMSRSAPDLEALFGAIDEVKADFGQAKANINAFVADVKRTFHDLGIVNVAPLQQNVSNFGHQLKTLVEGIRTVDASALRDDFQHRIEDLRVGVDGLKNLPRQPSATELADYFKNLGNLIDNLVDLVPNLVGDLARIEFREIREFINNAAELVRAVGAIASSLAVITFDEIKEFIANVEKVVSDAGMTIDHILQAVGGIAEVLDRFFALVIHLEATALETQRQIKSHSALMSTEGLESIFEQFIVDSYPSGHFPAPVIGARDLDRALLDTVEQLRSSNKKAPMLFLTGTDINASRSVIFSVATDAANNAVQDRNLWVIKLDDGSVGMVSGRMAQGKAGEFVFGAGHVDGEAAVRPVSTGSANGGASVPPATPAARAAAPAGRPMGRLIAAPEMPARGLSAPAPLGGHSLLVGAVLTSSAIPLAFPPKQWHFFSRNNVEFKHWFVDGGVVDNRPVDVAVKAGADVIVSFELTPLLSQSVEMKKIVNEKPGFMSVFSKSMLETTLDAGFFRYFEDLVSQNAPKTTGKLKIYRMAPMLYSNPADVQYAGANLDEHSIGVYDFNGCYDERGNLRMGLFDWLMRGYIDVNGGDPLDHNDPVLKAYDMLPGDFGALKNAYDGRRSGFFDASDKAYPETGPVLGIISARYGANGSFLDVGNALRGSIVGNRLQVTASNAIAGDPIPGVVKTLELSYSWVGGRPRNIAIPEGTSISLPN